MYFLSETQVVRNYAIQPMGWESEVWLFGGRCCGHLTFQPDNLVSKLYKRTCRSLKRAHSTKLFEGIQHETIIKSLQLRSDQSFAPYLLKLNIKSFNKKPCTQYSQCGNPVKNVCKEVSCMRRRGSFSRLFSLFSCFGFPRKPIHNLLAHFLSLKATSHRINHIYLQLFFVDEKPYPIGNVK